MKIGKTDDWEKKVCKVGQGSATCGFLMLGSAGFECSKGTGFEATIRMRLQSGSMKAKGDNCSGSPNFTETK